MKTYLKLIISTIIFFNGANCHAQTHNEGAMIVDVYYGSPNITSVLLKHFMKKASNVEYLRYKNFGPIGAKFEYMVTDEIGVGIDFNYSNRFISYTDIAIDSNQVYDTSYVSFTGPKFRGMGRLNYHFYDSYDFDAYFSVGVGYNFLNPLLEGSEFKNFLALAFRLNLGGRYYFKENIGLNLELGLGGGGVIQGGISYRI